MPSVPTTPNDAAWEIARLEKQADNLAREMTLAYTIAGEVARSVREVTGAVVVLWSLTFLGFGLFAKGISPWVSVGVYLFGLFLIRALARGQTSQRFQDAEEQNATVARLHAEADDLKARFSGSTLGARGASLN